MSRARTFAEAPPRAAGSALGPREQLLLVQAIEAAIDVHRIEHFHAWLAGPLRRLLAYGRLACLAVDGHGRVGDAGFLHPHADDALISAQLAAFVDDPANALARRLARRFLAGHALSCVADGERIATLLRAASGDRAATSWTPANALLHRARFLSGATYCFVFCDLADDQLARGVHLLRLLSSHLKLALARVIDNRTPPGRIALTGREHEIIGHLAGGRSAREIGAALAISPLTVKNHISKILRKLDARNRAEAVDRARAIAEQTIESIDSIDAIDSGNASAPTGGK